MGKTPLSMGCLEPWTQSSPLNDWLLASLAHGPCVRPSHGVPQRPMIVHVVEKKVAVEPAFQNRNALPWEIWSPDSHFRLNAPRFYLTLRKGNSHLNSMFLGRAVHGIYSRRIGPAHINLNIKILNILLADGLPESTPLSRYTFPCNFWVIRVISLTLTSNYEFTV